jgi:hypothetical protein
MDLFIHKSKSQPLCSQPYGPKRLGITHQYHCGYQSRLLSKHRIHTVAITYFYQPLRRGPVLTSQLLCGGLYCFFRSVDPFVEVYTALYILVGLSVETCTDYSIRRRFVLRFILVVLYCHFYRSALLVLHCTFHQWPFRGMFALHSLFHQSALEALYCPFYQSTLPWRLCTALLSVDLSVAVFVLPFLSVGPSVEALYCTFLLAHYKSL